MTYRGEFVNAEAADWVGIQRMLVAMLTSKLTSQYGHSATAHSRRRFRCQVVYCPRHRFRFNEPMDGSDAQLQNPASQLAGSFWISVCAEHLNRMVP